MVYRLALFASWLAGKVPRPARLALAGQITTLIYYLWASKRRATVANMANALGVAPQDPRARRMARQSWRNYGRYLSDFFYLPNATREQVIERMHDTTAAPGAFAAVDDVLAQGKGLIIVSAHFGAWDVAAVMVASRMPFNVLADSFVDPRMDELIQGQRRHFGMRVLRAEKSPRTILRALKENEAVAIVADRPMTARDGVPITFFGQRCYVPGGAAQLALLSGAPIAVGGVFYDEQFSPTYYIRMIEMIHPERGGDREAAMAALTQRIFGALENFIAPHLDQWFMFRPFWPAEERASAAPAQPLAEALVARDARGGAHE